MTVRLALQQCSPKVQKLWIKIGNLEISYALTKNDYVPSYFGSQCAILKSKVSLVTNMSLSSRTSCTLGGGSAMANPMKPMTNDGFLDFEVEWAGRSFPRINTTFLETRELFYFWQINFHYLK